MFIRNSLKISDREDSVKGCCWRRFWVAPPGPGVSRLRASRLRRAMGGRSQGSVDPAFALRLLRRAGWFL